MGAIVSFFSDEEVGKEKKKTQRLKKPAIYKGKEGPDFILLDYNKIYETRRYKRTLWVSTLAKADDGTTFEELAKISSKKLKTYLNGCNSSKIHMSMTCPLICKGTRAHENDKDMIFSMFLPEEYHENPPAPMSQELHLEEQPARLLYVASLKGLSNEEDWESRKDIMINELKYNAEVFEEGFYYRAVYSANVKDKRGYGEVWLSGINVEQEYICLRNDEESDE